MNKTIKVFLQKDSKIILLALKQPQTSTYVTDSRQLTENKSPYRGIQLLPASLLASNCTAKPLGFGNLNRLTVSKQMLYEKKTNTKRQCQSTSTALNLQSRKKAQKNQASIWTGERPNCLERWKRYTTSKLSAKPVHSLYNLRFSKYYTITSEFHFWKIPNLCIAVTGWG